MIGGPDYLVVRALGSGRVHVALVDPLDTTAATVFGSDATFVDLDPVVTCCGAQLRRSRGVVGVMRDYPVNCRACSTVSGVKRVVDGRVQ